jgi:hypothetical protein
MIIPKLTPKEIDEIKKQLTRLLIFPNRIAKGVIKRLRSNNNNGVSYIMHPFNDRNNDMYQVNFERGNHSCKCDKGKETCCEHILVVAEFRAKESNIEG